VIVFWLEVVVEDGVGVGLIVAVEVPGNEGERKKSASEIQIDCLTNPCHSFRRECH
jgi:hypothetical protein